MSHLVKFFHTVRAVNAHACGVMPVADVKDKRVIVYGTEIECFPCLNKIVSGVQFYNIPFRLTLRKGRGVDKNCQGNSGNGNGNQRFLFHGILPAGLCGLIYKNLIEYIKGKGDLLAENYFCGER